MMFPILLLCKSKNKKIFRWEFINEEGCLSVPEYYANVERAKEVEVEWFDNKGLKKVQFSGLMPIYSMRLII